MPDGPAGNYSSTTLLGGVDQRISRQRVYATGRPSYNKYFDQSSLNNTSYAANAGWDWATLGKLSGTVSANVNQSLANLNNNGDLLLAASNILNANQASASVRLGGGGVLSLEGFHAYSSVSYSAPQYLSSQSSGSSSSIGVYNRPHADIWARQRVSHARSRPTPSHSTARRAARRSTSRTPKTAATSTCRPNGARRRRRR